jgi:hypothetical protein
MNNGSLVSRRITGKILNQFIYWPVENNRRNKYLAVRVIGDHGRVIRTVHQLVARTFLGPPRGLETRHLNGDCRDNRLENLAYGTRAENAQDMVRHGTQWQQSKTECPMGHLLVEPNLRNRKDGRRACHVCLMASRYIKRHPEITLREEADRRYRMIMGNQLLTVI